MKHIYLTTFALSSLMAIGLCLQPIYAEPETATEETTEEKAEESSGLEEGSKEWKRAKLIACQKQTAAEYKDIRQLANLLKKAKNERDYKKINKLADDIIKKHSALYIENTPTKMEGVEITVEDLKPAHIKLGSKRRKLYKDFLEFTDKQRAKQQRSSWGAPDDDDKKKKKKKEKEPEVSINMGTLDKVKAILRVNQEDFASEIDAEYEEKNQNSPGY